MFDIIFAPWRYRYVSGADETSGAVKGCIFCEGPALEADRDSYIIHRGEHCFAILNLYPYTSGHLMVAPYSHVSTIEGLDDPALTELMTLARRAIKALRTAFDPDGFNLGMNVARAAGAGIEDHVHLHVVPRWDGDSNFMTVTARTRVLPCSMEDVFDALEGTL